MVGRSSGRSRPLLRPVSGEDSEAVAESRTHNEALVKLARRKSRKALEAALKSAAPDGKLSAVEDETRRATRRYVFKVQDDATEVVDAALKKIAKETGHTGGAALVDKANAIDSGYTVSLEDFMKKAGKEISLSTYVRLFGRLGEL